VRFGVHGIGHDWGWLITTVRQPRQINRRIIPPAPPAEVPPLSQNLGTLDYQEADPRLREDYWTWDARILRWLKAEFIAVWPFIRVALFVGGLFALAVFVDLTHRNAGFDALWEDISQARERNH